MSTCMPAKQSCASERRQPGTAFSLPSQTTSKCPLQLTSSPLQLTNARQAATNQDSSASEQNFMAASRDGATGTY